MFSKLKKIGNKAKIILFSAMMSAIMTVTAFASETGQSSDVSAITDSLSTGISDTKTTFLAILGVVVAGAMGFFAIKYAVSQGIGFFSKISKKG